MSVRRRRRFLPHLKPRSFTVDLYLPMFPSSHAHAPCIHAANGTLCLASRDRDIPPPLSSSYILYKIGPSHDYGRSQIKKIIDTADASPPGPAIGALTSENRDIWADARQALHRASSTGRTNANEETLRKIESAVIAVALDDSKPITREQVSHNVWSGNARNRWYDKHQLVVFDNGRSGFLGMFSFLFGVWFRGSRFC